MIKIYFDDLLIDDDNYISITNSFKLFEEEFMLGTTASNTFHIEVPFTEISNIPHQVLIMIDDMKYATLIVDDYEIKDNNVLSLSLTDQMVKLNFSYDASTIVPCTIKQLLDNICLVGGIDLGTVEFPNDDVIIDFYDNTISAREYVSYISELAGGYAIFGKDGKLYLKQFGSFSQDIDIGECEDFKIGQHHVIERVVFDNGLLKFETSSDESLETLYLNSDNPFIINQEIFDKIVEKILNFEFYSFETGNCPIYSTIIAGDLINFTDGENNYPSIAQYSLDYNGNWLGGYSLMINSKRQQETKQVGVSTQVKTLKVRLNRNESELDILSQKTSNNDSQIANLNIKADEIKSNVNLMMENTNENINILRQEQTELSQKANQITATITNIQNDCVQTIKNTMVVIDIEGIKVSVNTDAFSSLLNNRGIFLYKYGKEIGKFTPESTELDNLSVKNYFICGYHRKEKYNDENYGQMTGTFWVGE